MKRHTDIHVRIDARVFVKGYDTQMRKLMIRGKIRRQATRVTA